MIEEQGHIVELDGDYAWVESARRSSCGSCTSKGCGTGALDKVFGRRMQRIRVHNAIHAPLDSEVVLGIDESAFLQGSLAVYILPLVTMVCTAMLAEYFLPMLGIKPLDLTVAFSGLVGLALGFLVLKQLTSRIGSTKRFQAVVLRLAEPQSIITVNTKQLHDNNSGF